MSLLWDEVCTSICPSIQSFIVTKFLNDKMYANIVRCCLLPVHSLKSRLLIGCWIPNLLLNRKPKGTSFPREGPDVFPLGITSHESFQRVAAGGQGPHSNGGQPLPLQSEDTLKFLVFVPGQSIWCRWSMPQMAWTICHLCGQNFLWGVMGVIFMRGNFFGHWCNLHLTSSATTSNTIHAINKWTN